MTKQHFNYLAKAFKLERPDENWDANKKIQWNLCVKALADTCQHFNANFRREQFLSACGGLFDV